MKQYLYFIMALAISFQAQAQTELEKVKETVAPEDIKGHIYFLADDLLKGRETGTPENKIAALYLANSFRKYGVKPNPKTGTYYQEVQLQKTSPPERLELSLNGKKISDKVAVQSSKLDYTGQAVFLNYGLEEDYAGKNVTGKVVVVKAGNSAGADVRSAFGLRSKKQELAKKAGAIGIVELINADERSWNYIDHNFNASSLEVASGEAEMAQEELAHFWVLDRQGELEKSLSASKQLTANIEMDAQKKEIITTPNVIGIVEGTDPQLKNEYILYSAHYDHVGVGAPDETGDSIYNGARDNAVGTTTVLSMAENLAKFPTKRSALFILFTGEEKGLLGSQFFVENPVIPLEQIVYGFNSDNAGYNDTSVATIIGLERTTASGHIKKAAETFGIKAIDDPAPEQNLFDRSDNVHFAAKGIPAPTFSLGFRAFDGDVTKYYHRPGDEPETLDYDYLYKFFQAYVLAGRLIANDPETPFWTPGDKYEPAGKKLYNMN